MQRITQEEPWAKIPHWVVMCPDLDASAIRVYAVLSKHANKARQSFPGLVTLAAEACMSKHTVIKSLVQLEDAGAVIVKRERATNLRHKVNQYHLPLNRVGSAEIALGGSATVRLGSAEIAPLGSAEIAQELDPKNQLTRGDDSSKNLQDPDLPPLLPGESQWERIQRLRKELTGE